MAIATTGQEKWLYHQEGGNNGLKLTLDMVIGETSRIESTDKNRMEDLATRVKDLNARLADIRREQVFQRVSLLLSYRSYDDELADERLCRNERPSSEISPRPPTAAL
jgi:hypothetical protein